MKKLCRKKPSTSSSVHPSPDHLLPAFILTLAAALSPSDKEVLSYLIFHQTDKKHFKEKEKQNHSPVFTCDCFRCYTSYWARWDESVNRHVIHDIIDAYEDDLAKSKKVKTKKERKRKGSARVAELTQPESDPVAEEDTSMTELTQTEPDSVCDDKGSMRKLVSYIGERFWGVWN